MSIELNKTTEHLIDEELRSGRFPDAAALVDAAVFHFLVTREDLRFTRDQVDAMIEEAVAALERGEGVDGETFFAELEKKELELRR